MVEGNDTLARRIWDAQLALSQFEDRLEEIIGEFDSLGHDYYDESLEIVGAPDDVRLGLEAQQTIRDAGFGKVYLNHVGDRETRWETHYIFGDAPLPVRGWRRQAAENGFNISYWPESWNDERTKDWLATGYMTIVPDPLEEPRP